jgi:hypothetical protein
MRSSRGSATSIAQRARASPFMSSAFVARWPQNANDRGGANDGPAYAADNLTKILITRRERDFILKGSFHTERHEIRLIPRFVVKSDRIGSCS